MGHATSPLSTRSILRSCRLLQPLQDGQIDDLAAQSRMVSCGKNQVIWNHGHECEFIGAIGVGFVKMVRTRPTGVETTLEIMGPGHMFGVLGAFEGGGCPLTAMSMSRTVFVKVPKIAMMIYYESCHELKSALIRRVALRMHEKLDIMAQFANGRVEARLAALLFTLAESYGVPVGKAVSLEVPLTRQELGEMVGTTTETTIRTLSKWSREGVVSTTQQHITILSTELLEQKLDES